MTPFGIAYPRLLGDHRAFTLLEVLVAMIIFAIVLSTLYAAYIGTFKNIEETETQADIYDMARIALERMVEDLESVYISQREKGTEEEEEPSRQTQFEGKLAEVGGRRADTLRFISKAHLVFDEDEKEAGTAEIAYYVTEGSEGSEGSEGEGGLILYRSDTPGFKQPGEPGTGGWVLCDGLHGVQFSYYDHDGDTHDSWSATEDDEEPLPSAVSILLEFINPMDPESPIKFMTRVALPMAGMKNE